MINVVELKRPRYCLVHDLYPGKVTDVYKDSDTKQVTEVAVEFYTNDGVDYCNYFLPSAILQKINKRQFDRAYKKLSIVWAIKFVKECN